MPQRKYDAHLLKQAILKDYINYQTFADDCEMTRLGIQAIISGRSKGSRHSYQTMSDVLGIEKETIIKWCRGEK